MLRGVSIAQAGLAAEQVRSEVATHNLANSATNGYQRRVLATGSFTELLVSRIDATETKPRLIGALGGGPVVAVDGRDTVRGLTPGGSNVDPGQEMVELMAAVRAFAAIQRTVLAQDEVTRKAATELGRV